MASGRPPLAPPSSPPPPTSPARPPPPQLSLSGQPLLPATAWPPPPWRGATKPPRLPPLPRHPCQGTWLPPLRPHPHSPSVLRRSSRSRRRSTSPPRAPCRLLAAPRHPPRWWMCQAMPASPPGEGPLGGGLGAVPRLGRRAWARSEGLPQACGAAVPFPLFHDALPSPAVLALALPAPVAVPIAAPQPLPR